MTFRTFLTGTLTLGFSLIYPAWQSVVALESPGSTDDSQWLVYWLIFSLIGILESILWPVLQWIPLYFELKVAVLAWLVLPQTQGALFLYEAIISPAIHAGLKEAKKVPQLNKLLEDYGGGLQVATASDKASSAQRSEELTSTVKGVESALQSKLLAINSTADPAAKQAAARKFDRELAGLKKLSKGGYGAGAKSS